MIFISTANDGSNVINLTAGDDASVTIPLTMDDGSEYVLGNDEYLIFAVREAASKDSSLILRKESVPGSNEIVFAHEDTTDIVPGFYSAEAQLMTGDGKRITVWPMITGNNRTSSSNRKNFCVMSEVVYE